MNITTLMCRDNYPLENDELALLHLIHTCRNHNPAPLVLVDEKTGLSTVNSMGAHDTLESALADPNVKVIGHKGFHYWHWEALP